MEECVMTKSELIDSLSKGLSQEQSHLKGRDIELAVKCILEHMSQALADGDRIEIRGFGSFSLHFRPPRIGRNPKTGEAVDLEGKYVPHFKPGKNLRERVNKNFIPPEPEPVPVKTRTPKGRAQVAAAAKTATATKTAATKKATTTSSQTKTSKKTRS
jgi:integration host factor subunit beta